MDCTALTQVLYSCNILSDKRQDLLLVALLGGFTAVALML